MVVLALFSMLIIFLIVLTQTHFFPKKDQNDSMEVHNPANQNNEFNLLLPVGRV